MCSAVIFAAIIGASIVPLGAHADEACSVRILTPHATIAGSDGPDTVCIQADDVTYEAGAGNDTIYDEGNGNKVNLGTGDDTFDGSSGHATTVIGGEGDDVIIGTPDGDSITGDSGSDNINGGLGSDDILAGPGDDYIAGGEGADNLFGQAGVDRVFGGAGNDSLNGGEGIDYLTGGLGTNTCQKDRLDHVSGCFFDHKAPQLANISIDPNDSSLDSSIPGRILHVRVTLSDPGAGFLRSQFAFDGVDQIDFDHNVQTCSTGPALARGACKVSGNDARAVYELRFSLPQNLRKKRYYLTSVQTEDQAGNIANFWSQDLKAAKRAVSFAQTGDNDILPPVVTSAEVVANSIWRDISQSPILQVGYRDVGGHGLASLWLDYCAKSCEAAGSQVPIRMSGPWVGAPAHLRSVCPEDPQLTTVPCFVSGDGFAGVIRMRADDWSTSIASSNLAGPLYLRRYEPVDSVGNTNSLAPAKTLRAGFFVRKVVGLKTDSDHTPPLLTGLFVSPSHINTAASSQAVTIVATVKEVGTGLDSQQSSFGLYRHSNCGGSDCGYPYECELLTLNKISATISRVTTRCVVPAHAPSGHIDIGVFLKDKSSNYNYTDYLSQTLIDQGFIGFVTNG